ncbi:rod-binding protein [Sphingomonas profundi]|uniref:rod-binding protein n=1 Tax=Alterirhizorhabdus profundi TaxID=2681549 RepID=UPI0012E91BAD|nr:rod-binding protein [Sphingomonas profundi]
MQKVAKQFEAVFLRQMMGSMRQADLAEGVFDSSATGQFRDMADAKTAESMAETGGFGIAELLMRQYDKAHDDKTRGGNATDGSKVVTTPAVDSGT